MSKLRFTPGTNITYISTTIGNLLFKEFDLDDVNILSNIFMSIGDTLAILASQEEAFRDAEEKKTKDISS